MSDGRNVTRRKGVLGQWNPRLRNEVMCPESSQFIVQMVEDVDEVEDL